MSAAVTPPLCPECGAGICICDILLGHELKLFVKRPVKTPLFVAPPPPDGYRLERQEMYTSGDKTQWYHVRSFYDQSRRRRVKVRPYYASEVTANKIATRMRETSYHREVRVVQHWIDPADTPRQEWPIPGSVADALKQAGKWEILDNGKVVAQVEDKTVGDMETFTPFQFLEKYMKDAVTSVATKTLMTMDENKEIHWADDLAVFGSSVDGDNEI